MRIPTTSDIGHWSRNDRVGLGLLFLLHSARVAALATPFPSVRTGDFP